MTKKNGILLLILAGLVIVFLLTRLNTKTEKKMRLFDVDSLDIASITLSSAEDTLTFAKVNDAWQLSSPVNYPADQRQVKNLFETVFAIETSKTALSESKTALQTYQISDSAGTHVLVRDASGKELSHVIFGKSATGKTPARYAGSNKVYSAGQNVNYMITPKLDTWRDKYITNTETDLVSALEVTYDKLHYSLTRQDTAWVYDNGLETASIPFDKGIINTLLSGAAKLRTTSFIDDDTQYYLEQLKTPKLDVTFATYDNQSVRLRGVVYDEDDKKMVVQRDDDPTPLFIVYASMLDRFNKTAADMMK
jgi:hypothetical protein